MSRQLPSFSELDFGMADAKDERYRNKELLLEGYYDLHNAYEAVVDGDAFLVLGYKGAGKSALAQHMELRAVSGTKTTVRTVALNELSFSEFSDIIPGTTDWQARYPKVWDLVLWLQLLSSFSLDQEAASRLDVDFQSAISSLQSAGLLPAADISRSIRHYVEHPLKAPGLPEPTSSVGRLSTLTNLVENLSAIGTNFHSDRQHCLVIDGTDEVITEERDDEKRLLQILSALLESASKINRSGGRAKIIVLCRTDLFERLPGANKSKWRLDRAVELDWYKGGASDPHTSPLAQLANRKIRVAHPEVSNIFTEYLPSHKRYQGERRRLLTVLLHYTRHNPRDFLQLMTSIRDVVRDKGTGTASLAVSGERVIQGLTRYSRTYFGEAIRDEIWGPLGTRERDLVDAVLMGIGKERFTVDEFIERCERRAPSLDPHKTLELLFDCSALGNVKDISTDQGRKVQRIFRYRNPNAIFNPDDDVLVHLGWCGGLNIVSKVEHERRGLPDTAGSSEGIETSTGRRRVRTRRGADRDDPSLFDIPENQLQAEGSGYQVASTGPTEATVPPRNLKNVDSPIADKELLDVISENPAKADTSPQVLQPPSSRASRRRATRPQGPPATD